MPASPYSRGAPKREMPTSSDLLKVFSRVPTLGNLGEGSSTGDSEMDEWGSMDELPPYLFEEAPWRGPGEEFLH